MCWAARIRRHYDDTGRPAQAKCVHQVGRRILQVDTESSRPGSPEDRAGGARTTIAMTLDDIANPSPLDPSSGALVSRIVSIPMTLPSISTSGPPELPVIHGGIGLHVIVEGRAIRIPVDRTDDAGAERSSQAERITNGENRFTQTHIGAVSQREMRQRLRCADFQHSQM